MTFDALRCGPGRLAFVSALLVSLTVACERKPGTAAGDTATGDIVVGMYGSLTGDGASFGQSSREGTELAVDEVNSAGGLLGGRKIKLLVEDDQSKPEEASNAVTKLVTQDKVVAVLGEVASRRSLAAAPVCPEVPGADDHARRRPMNGSPRSATTSSASASSIRSRAKCSPSSPTTISRRGRSRSSRTFSRTTRSASPTRSRRTSPRSAARCSIRSATARATRTSRRS